MVTKTDHRGTYNTKELMQQLPCVQTDFIHVVPSFDTINARSYKE